MKNRYLTQALYIILIVLAFASCATSARLIRAQNDKTFGFGVAMISSKSVLPAQQALLKAIELASTGQLNQEAKSAIEGYLAFLNDGKISITDRASAEYNLSLAYFLTGDLESSAQHLEIARALAPEATHTNAFQVRVANARYESKHLELKGNLDTISQKVIITRDKLSTAIDKTNVNIADVKLAVNAVSEKIDLQSNKLLSALEKTNTTVDVLSSAIRESVKRMEENISNQNAILDRALGKYIPIKIPDGLNETINRLVSLSESKSTWPITDDKLEKFAIDINLAIRSTPPWAEKELLPRINKIRWALEAYKVINLSNQKNDINFGQLFSACEDVLESTVEEPQKDLLDVLKEIKNKTEIKVALERKSRLIKSAEDALADKGDVAQAWSGLESLLSDNQDKAKVEEYRQKLRAKAVNAQADAQIKTLSDSSVSIENESDWKLRQIGYQQILSNATSQQLAFRLEKDLNDNSMSQLKSIRSNAQSKLDKISADRYLGYQRWALNQIKSCENEFKQAQKQAKNNGWSGWKEAEYNKVKYAMINNLIAINTGLLDTGVNQQYQRVYALTTKQLDGREDLIAIAEQAAVVKKKGINDYEE